jgi:hypothetical protein
MKAAARPSVILREVMVVKRKRKERVPGGLAAGMRPSDFDIEQLSRGIEVEMEHTPDWRVAREIAMDHLVEHPDYYDYLDAAEERMERGLEPNRRKKVRVYDAADLAMNMRETFQAAPVQEEIEFPFDWPEVMQNVGDSLAVAYSSDKWRESGDMEMYKHLAESRNKVLCVPGLIHDYYEPGETMEVIGPYVSYADVPMPDSFAILALFEEIDLKLYVSGTDKAPKFGKGRNAGVMKVTVKHGMLGGSKICWSKVSRRKDQPFLFVYTEDEGVLMIVVGDELDIERDGIVG